jgi:hypothetical protein
MTQLWHFHLKIAITVGRPDSIMIVEAGLNKKVEQRLNVTHIFPTRTASRAYFTPGSASEFSLSAAEAFIEPSVNEVALLPFIVYYEPKMYGKRMRGLLVVDTLEAQWTFEFIGKVPDYKPPVIEKSGRIDISIPESAIKWAEMKGNEKKRNVIKENIDSVKLAVPRPMTSLGQRGPRIGNRPASSAGARTMGGAEKK